MATLDMRDGRAETGATEAVQTQAFDVIVIGGGPCTYNPEPIAPFFDLFYMGGRACRA